MGKLQPVQLGSTYTCIRVEHVSPNHEIFVHKSRARAIVTERNKGIKLSSYAASYMSCLSDMIFPKLLNHRFYTGDPNQRVYPKMRLRSRMCQVAHFAWRQSDIYSFDTFYK
jgi:hypothetical protein